MIDVLQGKSLRVECLPPHGFVELIDAMPRLVPEDRPTCDFAVAQAARTSTGLGLKSPEEDRNLIRYCMRHAHTSVFEMVEFKWVMAMPIFVARQFIRHRTANVNEFSGRYSVMPDLFYYPEDARLQSTTNKQGSEDAKVPEDVSQRFTEWLTRTSGESFTAYEGLVKDGVARELARVGLPLNLYTRWTWKCDLHNTFHFLRLRADSHAQKEIRVYAEAMLRILTPLIPDCMSAWMDYVKDAMVLTSAEIDALRGIIGEGVPQLTGMSKREQTEWEEKLARLRSPNR